MAVTKKKKIKLTADESIKETFLSGERAISKRIYNKTIKILYFIIC